MPSEICLIHIELGKYGKYVGDDADCVAPTRQGELGHAHQEYNVP